MKKLIITLFSFFYSFIILSNPIYIPKIVLDEFSFDDNKIWKIILIPYKLFDSILISSSTEKSIYQINPELENDYLIITSDSLNSKVNINYEGDSISIISYYLSWQNKIDSVVETIVFGNYTNSTIPAPLKGQSIKSFLIDEIFYYCLSDSLNNMFGTLHGHIYDKYNNLITHGLFSINPFPEIREWPDKVEYVIEVFSIANNGYFSILLYSRKYNFRRILTLNQGYCELPSCYKSVAIFPIDLSIYPDSSHEIDIYLLDDISGINQNVIIEYAPLKVFPNPNNGISFSYKISIPVKSTHCSINLFNINGQIIQHYNISDNSGELQLPLNITNGTYLLELLMNERPYFSTPLIVDKK